jgi:hypothetical protein
MSNETDEETASSEPYRSRHEGSPTSTACRYASTAFRTAVFSFAVSAMSSSERSLDSEGETGEVGFFVFGSAEDGIGC